MIVLSSVQMCIQDSTDPFRRGPLAHPVMTMIMVMMIIMMMTMMMIIIVPRDFPELS